MRFGVWGTGSVGEGVACRLATAPFVSQLLLINRNVAKAHGRAIDITHGLSFAPTCWSVRAIDQANARAHLGEIDALVLTLGEGVPQGGTRQEAYLGNRKMFRAAVIPALKGFTGIVIVVSNPVDLMARLVATEAGLPAGRVIGLGTVVESARLRAALAANAVPARAPHDVWAFVVGSHDEECVVVPQGHLAPGRPTTADEMEVARAEIIQAAERVKSHGGATREQRVGTLHPIVEGVHAVAAAVATNARRTMTVSVLDPDDQDQLFYSVPCLVGRDGAVRDPTALPDDDLQEAVAGSKQRLRETLLQAGP